MTEAVVSAAWLAATRWSASATRLRARRFASTCASSSCWRTRRASSWRIKLLGALQQRGLRLADGHAGDRLEQLELALVRLLELLLELLGVHLAVGDALLAPLELEAAAVELLLAVEQPLLDLLEPAALVVQLALELGAHLDRLLARLDAAPRAGSPPPGASRVREQLVTRCGAPRRHASRPPSGARAATRDRSDQEPDQHPVTISISLLPLLRGVARGGLSPERDRTDAIGSREPPGLLQKAS